MIKIRNLFKSFGSLQVLKGINLDVAAGETLVLVGASGSGKSVFLRSVLGLSPPDSGSVMIDGLEVTKLSEKEKLSKLSNTGMLFQASALFDSLTIGENVGIYLKEHTDKSEEEIKELVHDALKRVGLNDVEDKMPSELSGGMKKRASLARLIVYRPQYLFYDEPTTGLDPMTGSMINELIVQIQNDLKATSIVVTHDPTTTLYVSDKIALIENGQILYVEETDKFMQISHPTVDFFNKITGHDYKNMMRKKNG
ncbi:MAG: ATP-binding cassette domain-containing protein [Chlamydiae bacterium]|nr:ATP-binding cassette domain-containing protein [Chlamydiota bacterium]